VSKATPRDATHRVSHLARRFFGSLVPRQLDDGDEAWVRLSLTPEELSVWQRLGRADRAESVAVGYATVRELGPDADPRWVAAALLHDVGKADARLGPVRRAAATVIAAAASHGRARSWSNWVGIYVNHDERGADRLAAAGARPECVAWARVHHRPDLWRQTGIPPEICALLARADGETPDQ
jgi:hypothetical protein